MAPPILKVLCPGCEHPFLTYESDKKFCNPACEAHLIYTKRHGISPSIRIKMKPKKNCVFCNQETKFKFCDKLCESNHIKRERLKDNKKSFLKEKKPVGRNSLKNAQKIENQRLYYERSWERKFNIWRG